uniref:Uncharacterized protein n=1 Tax=Arundo donax TaxID=35708 RepID=A0A0A9B8B3_ARUDO
MVSNINKPFSLKQVGVG